MLLKSVHPVFTEQNEAKQSGTKPWVCRGRGWRKTCSTTFEKPCRNLSMKSVKRIKWLCHIKGKTKNMSLK